MWLLLVPRAAVTVAARVRVRMRVRVKVRGRLRVWVRARVWARVQVRRQWPRVGVVWPHQMLLSRRLLRKRMLRDVPHTAGRAGRAVAAVRRRGGGLGEGGERRGAVCPPRWGGARAGGRGTGAPAGGCGARGGGGDCGRRRRLQRRGRRWRWRQRWGGDGGWRRAASAAAPVGAGSAPSARPVVHVGGDGAPRRPPASAIVPGREGAGCAARRPGRGPPVMLPWARGRLRGGGRAAEWRARGGTS